MLNEKFINILQSTVAQLVVQFDTDVDLDEDAYERMKKLALLADMLADEFDAEDCGMHIDASGGLSYYSIEVFDIVLQDGNKHPFFELIQTADYFNFSNKNDNVLITFGVEGLLIPNE